MQINLAQRELTLKLVYYGPALSGKTTNLRALHALAPPAGVGRLMNLETRDDRTLFFDLLPMFVRTGSGLKVKLKLYTVPGQVIHESTRRVVLQQADGVVFVADSQVAETEANQEAFAGLRRNMKAVELPKALPLVVQFNKRDLPDIRSDRELARFARRSGTRVYPAVAVRGVGVRETLEGLLGQVFDDLVERHDLANILKVDGPRFLQQVFAGWGPAANIGVLP
ncbi:MAG: GTPase domain-containing protein [Myxococcales bacterium]|nr:GTPase domain-containing protein [Myxococcales bacterium]